jgi:hypothetical protein
MPNMIADWREEGKFKPENVVSSDISLKELRKEISTWSQQKKIDYAHRLAAQTHCKGDGAASSDKLLTVISRLVKLQRSMDQYRDMLELKREKERNER